MFAVVTRVELPEGQTIEEGRRTLESEVLPLLKDIPGLVHAYFLAPPTGREGLSIVVVESEEVAKMGAEQMKLPAGVKLLSTEVREVAASL